jgi:hypothetical protein
MDSTDLTADQLSKMRHGLSGHCRYLHRLVERMDAVGWDKKDPLYQSAFEAMRAAEGLAIALHYAGCIGTGYPRIVE